MKESKFEFWACAVILLFCISFMSFLIISMTNNSNNNIYYAKFNDSIDRNAQIKIHGYKVGFVSKTKLLEDYQVLVTCSIDKNIKIPVDSKISISRCNLFSSESKELVIVPGNDSKAMNNNDEFIYTNDGVNIFDLIKNGLKFFKS